MVSNKKGDIQHEGPSEGEQEYDESPSCNFCTFAVTGNRTTWQAIYICHECVNENEASTTPLCICQACADHCHHDDEHEVEYIGMGPAYCDCDCIGNCGIFPDSLKEAERLGMLQSRDSQIPAPANDNSSPKDPLEHEAFEIPALSDPEMSSLLVEHAQELIQHTKETHWIDNKSNLNDLCPLESLAWRIYQHHVNRYIKPTPAEQSSSQGGSEWWVQVKDTSGSATAIDLHYDKDEALAESFCKEPLCLPFLRQMTFLSVY